MANDVGYMEMGGCLLQVLQDRCSWSNKDLLEALGVDFLDVDSISAIAQQAPGSGLGQRRAKRLEVDC